MTEAPGTAEPTAAEQGLVSLRDSAQLDEILGEPHPIVIEKVHRELVGDDLKILARSPFCVISTADALGNCDASPRGDAPGFVHVVDANTIAIPDRPGNRRGDSFRNMLENPRVGTLHLVPGSSDVLRINGRVTILTDAPFFEAMAARGRKPKLALLVRIDEIYRHCPQSLRRAGLWETADWPYD
ncbi:MSMEG_1061 family FMN-dependent PPOX-type flavoprotein [Streptomyces sp. SM12]|uniref:MSMEG_1061 family FMN-dependent PPOX-type flavoprotein n=1 Tax=Streptomyces TaxID=1883 RepID=UPI000CD51400